MSTEKSPAEWVERLGRDDEAQVARAHKYLVAQLEEEKTRDEAASALLAEVRREDAKAREQALGLLQAFWWPVPAEMASDAIESILEGLGYIDPEEPQEVEDASLLLTTLVRQAPDQLQRIVAALEHSWHTVRWAAVSTIGRSEVSRDVLPGVLKLLNDDSADVQSAALEALGALAPLDPKAIAPVLLAQAVERSGAERYMALATLRGLLDTVEEPLDATTGLSDPQSALSLLEDEHTPILLEAVAVTGYLGRKDEATIAALRKTLRNRDPDVGATSAVALLRLLDDDAMANGTLGTLLCSPSQKDSGAAFTQLEMLDTPMIARAKPALELAATKASDEAVRNESKKMLAKLVRKKA